MNAFDQYEVWFVTGAQLLYGGDAVIAVDAHSTKKNVSVSSLGCILSLLLKCGFTACSS